MTCWTILAQHEKERLNQSVMLVIGSDSREWLLEVLRRMAAIIFHQEWLNQAAAAVGSNSGERCVEIMGAGNSECTTTVFLQAGCDPF